MTDCGVSAVSLPLIDIVPTDGAAADAAWQLLPSAGLAMFVSPNAVMQFFARRPVGQIWPSQTLAACVGPGSAQALLAEGVPAELIVQPAADAASLDSEHLWPQLQARGPWAGKLCLMLRGDGGREWLSERLQEEGAETRGFNVYQRRSPCLNADGQDLLDEILGAPSRHVWLFSSAEAIGYLQGLAPAATDWSAGLCIATHARIAARARALGFGHVVLARPEAASVAEAFGAMRG
ncbi:uroporphyrinogen-III synthase [Paucibacter sp. AS339]|uniref:uroporphyrinogen-III synthase n=1 Tax=Paucibacter hankyongi TaxID=3133434 RepID=UPI0030974EFE